MWGKIAGAKRLTRSQLHLGSVWDRCCSEERAKQRSCFAMLHPIPTKFTQRPCLAMLHLTPPKCMQRPCSAMLHLIPPKFKHRSCLATLRLILTKRIQRSGFAYATYVRATLTLHSYPACAPLIMFQPASLINPRVQNCIYCIYWALESETYFCEKRVNTMTPPDRCPPCNVYATLMLARVLLVPPPPTRCLPDP